MSGTRICCFRTSNVLLFSIHDVLRSEKKQSPSLSRAGTFRSKKKHRFFKTVFFFFFFFLRNKRVTRHAMCVHSLFVFSGTFTLVNLSPDTEYITKILAINRAGSSDFTDPIVVRTLPTIVNNGAPALPGVMMLVAAAAYAAVRL